MKHMILLSSLALCGVLSITVTATAESGTKSPAAEEVDALPCAEHAVSEPIELFNGEDLDNWKLFIPDENVDPATVWHIEDGVVHCKGTPRGYMRTKKKYSNYKLTVEWRWPEDSGNSGVLLHIQDKDEVWPKSIEAQMQSLHAGDFWVIGGTSFDQHTSAVDRRVPKMEDSTEKELGKWNTYSIHCHGNKIKVYVNGVLQNIATNATVCSGYIGLQSEGTPVEFRTVRVEPLN
ncbi:MAG: DUF1080 domain-containing protein [Candidatus Hydrogenedentota bacterium]